MTKIFQNCTVTVLTERESVLDNFTAKVQMLASNELVLTEKIVKKYESNPKVFESETLSLSFDKRGMVNLYIKKFAPADSQKFLATLYEDIKQAFYCLTNAKGEA
jgi:hypothetical protein